MSKEADAAVLAYEATVEGDVDAATQWLHERPESDEPELDAWRLALRGCLALTVGGVAPPTVSELSALVSASEPPSPRLLAPLGHALEWLSLAAIATFDTATIHAGHGMARRLYSGADPRLRLADAERALARGELVAARDLLGPLRPVDESASSLGVRALCVDALAAGGLGAVEDATLAARTASRRARILRRRPYRYVAGLCLAQARRRSGRPHLAVRILSALEPLVPPLYRGWLTLEQIAVGQFRPSASPRGGDGADATPARVLAEAVASVLKSASAGDRPSFEVAARRLAEVADFVPAASYRILPALLDPSVTEPSDEIRPFLDGRQASIPRGLELLAAGIDAAAWPVAAHHPLEGTPRRVMSAGLGLASEDVELVPASRLRQGRTDVGAAVLALAPGPLSEEAFFRQTFGMRFVPPVHESVLAMTLSRVRRKLEDVAEVTRGGGEVTLRARRSFAVPDPRCAPPPEGAVLRLVAQHGRITARGAAKTLGVSLRTVQSAVRQLVSDGELELDRAGRSIAYRVDDTSFTTPGG